MTGTSARWRDLGTRVMSAVVMVAGAALALTSGPGGWTLFVFAVYCLMLWELVGLCDPAAGLGVRLWLAVFPLLYPLIVLGTAALSGAEPLLAAEAQGPFGRGYYSAAAGLLAPLVLGLAHLRAGRALWAGYGAVLVAAVLFMIYAQGAHGLVAVVALVAIVAVTDTAGYFAGRALGGPKFWPALSPNKTWSGTAAGWIGAGLVGGLVLPHLGVPLGSAVLVAVAISFASQLGDIAESAMKRRVGVKDASALIPGHGGVLDRVDGLVAAACLAGAITLVSGG